MNNKDLQISVREQLGQLLLSLNLNGYGIEIGVAEGNFSEILLSTSNLKELYMVDAWQNFGDKYVDINNVSDREQLSRYLKVVHRMKKFGNRATVLRGDCNAMVEHFMDNVFDFVYLDADHSYEFVKKNLNDWYPKVKVGGIFAGHDYLDGKDLAGTVFGVKSAVDEFVEENNVKLYVTTDDTPYFSDGTLAPKHLRYFSWYFVKEEQ